MAIIVVRTTAKATTASGNASASFTGVPRAGNRVIALGHTYGGGGSAPPPPTVTDQVGSAYKVHISHNDSGDAARSAVVSGILAQDRDANQITWANAAFSNTFAAMEVSGTDFDSPRLTASGRDATSPFELATGTLLHGNCLVCSCFAFIGSADQDENIAANTWGGNNPSTLWTNDGPGIVGEFGAGAYAIVSGVGTFNVGFVADNNGDGSSHAIVLAAFPPAVKTKRVRKTRRSKTGWDWSELNVKHWW